MSRMEDYTKPMPIPSWMIINAVRYCIGRMSYQVSTTVDWLMINWKKLPRHARLIVRHDLEEAFQRDDVWLADGKPGLGGPLGMDMDRRQWERVRALYQEDRIGD